MKKVILIFIICTTFLMGCQNGVAKNNSVNKSQDTSKNIVINYEGRSRNWAAVYKIDGNEDLHDSYFTFRYTGEDANLVENINYSIDGPKEGESGKFIFNNTKEYTGKIRMTGGIPSSTDRDIDVKLEWNGNTELLLLRKSK